MNYESLINILNSQSRNFNFHNEILTCNINNIKINFKLNTKNSLYNLKYNLDVVRNFNEKIDSIKKLSIYFNDEFLKQDEELKLILKEKVKNIITSDFNILFFNKNENLKVHHFMFNVSYSKVASNIYNARLILFKVKNNYYLSGNGLLIEVDYNPITNNLYFINCLVNVKINNLQLLNSIYKVALCYNDGVNFKKKFNNNVSINYNGHLIINLNSILRKNKYKNLLKSITLDNKLEQTKCYVIFDSYLNDSFKVMKAKEIKNFSDIVSNDIEEFITFVNNQYRSINKSLILTD